MAQPSGLGCSGSRITTATAEPRASSSSAATSRAPGRLGSPLAKVSPGGLDPDMATISWQIMTGERSILPVDCDVVYVRAERFLVIGPA